MRKILVPIDGSIASIKAAEQAILIAKEYGSSVTFFSVVAKDSDLPFNEFGGLEKFAYLQEEMINLKIANTNKILNDIKDLLNCADIEVNQKIIVGFPHPKIIEEAKRESYDLIVMGHRGLNPSKRLFLGSVVKRVIEDAPCSVFIAKSWLL